MNAEDVALPWSYWDDTVEIELRADSYPYGGGIAQAGLQITLGRRSDGQIMAVRLPAERAREFAVALLGVTVPGEIPPFDEDPVAIKLGLVDAPDPPLNAYLVVRPSGGPLFWAGLDQDRAHEAARNTGCVVVELPVVGDYRTEEKP